MIHTKQPLIYTVLFVFVLLLAVKNVVDADESSPTAKRIGGG
jgi:hypothetical protein